MIGTESEREKMLGVKNYERNHILREITLNELTARDYTANA